MREVKFREIKTEIRVLGIDDGAFTPHTKGDVDLIGAVFRGGYWLEGIMRAEVQLDGLDATEKIAKMVMESPHYEQLRVIMLNGITFAGFNVVDIKKLFELTGLPIIALTKEKPDLNQVKKALRNLPDWEKRWEYLEKAGKIYCFKTKNDAEPVYMQIVGITKENAEKIIKITCTRSSVPEALRVAHIIASGLIKSSWKHAKNKKV